MGEVQAADFAYAWKKLVDPKTMGPNAYLLDNVVNSQDIREGKADIATIGLETPDEKTFVVHLEQQPSFYRWCRLVVSASKTVLC